jgi:two-component system cell cycle sensor histidine kinase/response regulator CckA
VADLITVARGIATTKEILSLNTVIQEYMQSSAQKEIEILKPRITFKADLASGLLNIRCSESHIVKSLANLVLNASEAIEDKGIVTISTKNRYLDGPLKGYEDVRAGKYVLLTVSDNGIGISPTHLERIFEPFYTKKIMGRSGTGLGLAVVWNMVQDHNGYINVKSDDKGTEIDLYIPATRDPAGVDNSQIQVLDYMGD